MKCAVVWRQEMTCSSIYFNPMNVRSRYTHTTRKALRKVPPMKKKRKKKNLHAKKVVHQTQPRLIYIFFVIFRIMCTPLLNGGITKPNFRGIYKLRLFIAWLTYCLVRTILKYAKITITMDNIRNLPPDFFVVVNVKVKWYSFKHQLE